MEMSFFTDHLTGIARYSLLCFTATKYIRSKARLRRAFMRSSFALEHNFLLSALLELLLISSDSEGSITLNH